MVLLRVHCNRFLSSHWASTTLIKKVPAGAAVSEMIVAQFSNFKHDLEKFTWMYIILLWNLITIWENCLKKSCANEGQFGKTLV